MKDIRVLLTAAGGLGVTGVIDALLSNGERNIDIISTDIRESTLVGQLTKYRKVPPGNAEGYIESILNLIKDEAIDVIIPLATNELLPFSYNRNLFENIGVKVCISSPTAIENALDKGKCYQILKERNLHPPDFFLVKNIEEFKAAVASLGYPENPVCFKPSRHMHGGGRGFRILNANTKPEDILFQKRPESPYISYDEAIRIMERMKDFPELLVMEYLPGEEYSVYALCEDGKALYIVPNLRQRLMLMYSFEAEVRNNQEIVKLVKSIIDVFGFDYNVNLQIKYSSSGVPKVVEINPRIAGTIILPVAAGVNLPYLGIKLALKEEIPLNLHIRYGTKMLRFWKEAFLYDTTIFQYKPRPKMATI